MNFFSSYISPNAEKYVAEVLRSGMLSEGEWTRRFEKALEKELGVLENSIIAVNSGTSALHLALKTLGIGRPHEVIIPPNTFVATGLAVLYCNAKVVFCDILPDGNIDPSKIPALITPWTKAIISVNWAGKDCGVWELERVADKYGLKLIIDAAQSFGCEVGGDAVCYSFQAIKHLTTGDGGAVWFKEQDHHEYARKLSWFGIDKEKDLPGLFGERAYLLDSVGFKYHMNNIAAAIGLANIEGIRERIAYRKRLARIYKDNLMTVEPIHEFDAVFWQYPIRVDDTEKFALYCQENGIPYSNIHRGVDCNPIFGGKDNSLVGERDWEAHVTHLPIHHELTENDVKWICEKVNQYV